MRYLLILNGAITALTGAIGLVLAVVCIMYAFHADLSPRVGDELPLLLISVVIFGVMSGAWYLAMLSIKRRAGWWWQAQLAALAIGLVCSLVLYQQYR